jgi:hypothetical protein
MEEIEAIRQILVERQVQQPGLDLMPPRVTGQRPSEAPSETVSALSDPRTSGVDVDESKNEPLQSSEDVPSVAPIPADRPNLKAVLRLPELSWPFWVKLLIPGMAMVVIAGAVWYRSLERTRRGGGPAPTIGHIEKVKALEPLTARVVNVLGVSDDLHEFKVTYDEATGSNSVLAFIAATCSHLDSLCVATTANIYIAIPYPALKEVRLGDHGRHNVVLKDGKVLQGGLMGALTSRADQGSHRHDLASVTELTINGGPEQVLLPGGGSDRGWRVSGSKSDIDRLTLRNLRFVYDDTHRYVSPHGMIVEFTSDFEVGICDSCRLAYSGEKPTKGMISASISEFQEIAFRTDTVTEAPFGPRVVNAGVSTTSPSGVKTLGMLVLNHIIGMGWTGFAIVADAPGLDGSTVVLLNPNCTFTKQ